MEEVAQKEKSKTEVNTMAILSYLGPLCLVPLLTGEKDEFVKFHVKQGLVLFIFEALVWIIFSLILGSMTWSWYTWGALGMFSMLQTLLYLCVGILSVVGIINVLNGQRKELPFVGKFAEKITFVK